jgi:hypothetical protein
VLAGARPIGSSDLFPDELADADDGRDETERSCSQDLGVRRERLLGHNGAEEVHPEQAAEDEDDTAGDPPHVVAPSDFDADYLMGYDCQIANGRTQTTRGCCA